MANNGQKKEEFHIKPLTGKECVNKGVERVKTDKTNTLEIWLNEFNVNDQATKRIKG